MRVTRKVFFILFFLLTLTFFSSFIDASSVGLIEDSIWQSNLTPIRFGTTVLGYINNDDEIDLVVTGCLSDGGLSCTSGTIAKVYINNGTSFTENQTWQQNLTAVGHSSIALGDIDNDGDLDLALTGCTSADDYGDCVGSITAKIYLNNGTSFTENQTWQQNLTATFKSSTLLGDIDNDGKLDLMIIGSTSIQRIAKVYINNGTSFEENSTWQQNLTAVRYGNIALGDIDNDGDLDLALTGQASGGISRTKIYVNNGTSLVESSIWQQNLIAAQESSIACGDYDNDRDIDLVLIGVGDYLFTYKNNGSIFLEHQKNSGEGGDLGGGLFDGSIAFGDYDNDGDLDFVGMGRESGRNEIYNNDQILGYNFTIDSIAGNDFKGDDMHDGPLVWGDYDKDSNLDLIAIGTNTGIGVIAKIYINNNTINNTIPQPPNSSFSASYSNNQLTLSWGNGSDNETITNGLYYNLRLGTTSGSNQIISGVYGGSSGGGGGGGGSAGYFGNMMQRRSITLHGDWLQANTTYYWSVQTIDTGLAKSAWSVEQNLTLAGDINAPSITLNEPDDNNYTSFTNVTFNATVSDNVNVSNVSLYGTWGNWHRNQTNSSGINGTAYLFQANLSAYDEGSYTWAIQACDTTGNCIFSANRTVIRDLTYPLVYLESPANSSSWTDNNSVTFSFNVTDLAIQNCSLIINGYSLKYNFSSVTVNTSTSTSVTLDNGNYNWSVNCTDMLLRQNSSARRQLTVNYQAPSAPLGGGGGGGISYKTYELGDLKEAQEINRELAKGDKINFNLKGEKHKLEVKKVTSNNAVIEINSSAFNFTLAVNESRKFNLSNAEFYALLVRLNEIKNLKANLTIMAINEAISMPKPVENATNISEKPKEPEQETKETLEGKQKSLFFLSYIFAAIVIIILFSVYVSKRRLRTASIKEILGLIEQIKANIEKGDLETAEALYQKAKQVFDKLGKGDKEETYPELINLYKEIRGMED